MLNPNKSDEWNQGYAAYLLGWRRLDCPYKHSTVEYLKWQEGFSVAQVQVLKEVGIYND